MSTPAIAAAQRLLRLGFGRIPIIDEHGRPTALLFLREWNGWHEALLVDPTERARGYRLSTWFDVLDPLSAPGTATVITGDDVVSVVQALLADGRREPPTPRPPLDGRPS